MFSFMELCNSPVWLGGSIMVVVYLIILARNSKANILAPDETAE